MNENIEEPKTFEELVKYYEQQFFNENGYILTGKAKKVLRKKLEKEYNRRLKNNI